MTVIGILSIMFEAGDSGIILWANELVGNWGFWLIIIGFLLFVPGIYYLYVFIKQLREFRELMSTSSKAVFIKNQDRIEELAWRLHPKYEKTVIEKKAKLKVR